MTEKYLAQFSFFFHCSNAEEAGAGSAVSLKHRGRQVRKGGGGGTAGAQGEAGAAEASESFRFICPAWEAVFCLGKPLQVVYLGLFRSKNWGKLK